MFTTYTEFYNADLQIFETIIVDSFKPPRVVQQLWNSHTSILGKINDYPENWEKTFLWKRSLSSGQLKATKMEKRWVGTIYCPSHLILTDRADPLCWQGYELFHRHTSTNPLVITTFYESCFWDFISWASCSPAIPSPPLLVHSCINDFTKCRKRTLK